MTVYSIPEIRQIWLRNGGSPALSPIAVAVCLAESNGWAEAVSPAKDYGLWQINIANFAHYGLTVSRAFNPDLNAQVAISMSSNGTNWAPWCTCWINPARDCGHGLLSMPQRDTPAWNRLAGVNAVLGTVTAAPASTASTPNAVGFTSAWNTVAELFGPYARSQHSTLSTIVTQIGNLTR